MKVILLVDENYEDLELWYPKLRCEEAKIQVVVSGANKGHLYYGKHGYPCKSDASFEEINVGDFDGIIIPGGFAPDKLRRYPKVLEIIKDLDAKGKMIAFICHGGWVPISAKVLNGVQVTGTSAIKDDLENAGAIWNDKPLVIDRHFISSRNPGDLPVFGNAIVQAKTSVDAGK